MTSGVWAMAYVGSEAATSVLPLETIVSLFPPQPAAIALGYLAGKPLRPVARLLMSRASAWQSPRLARAIRVWSSASVPIGIGLFQGCLSPPLSPPRSGPILER